MERYNYDESEDEERGSNNIEVETDEEKVFNTLIDMILDDDEDILKNFIDNNNIDINKETRSATLLYVAINENKKNIVKMLLKYPNIDLEYKDVDGETYIMTAIRNASHEILKILLNKVPKSLGAVKSNNNETVYDLLRQNDGGTYQRKKLKLINDKFGNKMTNEEKLLDAIYENDKKSLIKLLKNKQININKQIELFSNQTPLIVAIRLKKRDFFKILMKQPKLDINKIGTGGMSPLMHSVQLQNIYIVKQILKHPKIDVNYKTTRENNTALLFAVPGNDNITKLLLKRKDIDVNIKNISDASSLEFAVKKNKIEIVKLLLDKPSIKINDIIIFYSLMVEGSGMLKMLLKHSKIKKDATYSGKDVFYIVNHLGSVVNREQKKQILEPYREEIQREKIEAKKKRTIMLKKIKEKIKKAEEGSAARAKEAIAKQKLGRKRNKVCKNDKDFILQEDIEDIPTEELTYIKRGKEVFCLDNTSFSGMIKHSTPVRGACKKAIRGKPLECEWFYPINIGFNVYITKENWETVKRNVDKYRKWVLGNKRVVDFTTGLHMMSEKSGKDNVYVLKPQKYQVGGKMKLKMLKKKKVSKRKVSKKKKVSKKQIRKHKGINQKTGRLNKGYKYSGKKLKSGLKQIVKV